MSRNRFSLSGYRGVWLFVMFDLPVDTKTARKRYAQFRSLLLHEGFAQMQYSIYARYFSSEEQSEPSVGRISSRVPPKGAVRLLTVTDRQFGKMQCFHGKTAVPTEKPPQQLLLF